MTDRYDIIIGGGSFTGLALARALAVCLGGELKIAVIEPRTLPAAGVPLPAPDGRAITLSASSVRLLAAIGVWDAVSARAQPISSIDITDTSLSATVRLPVLTYANALEHDEAASWVIETAPMNAALLDAVRGSTGITILDGQGIDRFSATAPAIEVTTSGGSTLTAALLIAADGRGSSLRQGAGIKSVSWRHEQIGILTIVEHELPHEGRAVQHFLPSGPFATLPLKGAGPTFPQGGRSCVTWSEAAEVGGAIMRLDDAGFLAELERRFGTRLGDLALAAPRSSYPLDTQLARSYIARRLALVGDAAHGIHPIAGQGLNLALRDVAALTESIADAARLGLDIGSGEPLERYERWRRFDSTLAAVTMDGLNRLFSSDWTLVRTIRDTGAGIIDRLPTLKRALVREAAGVTGETPKLLQGRAA